MPMTHCWNELNFMYPDSWKVIEDDAPGSLSIESPEGAFLSLARPVDIDSAFASAKKVMEGEYEEVESEKFTKVVGEALLEGVIQRFVYLDLIIASYLAVLEVDEEPFPALLIQIQGEDRDLDKQMPVFEAILASLKVSQQT
jgi:hypothetical protein